MQDAARDYVERHIEPGDFLSAVLSNDLMGAFGKADGTNLHSMHDWALWLYNDCPDRAWGSPEKFAAWIAEGQTAREEPRVTPGY